MDYESYGYKGIKVMGYKQNQRIADLAGKKEVNMEKQSFYSHHACMMTREIRRGIKEVIQLSDKAKNVAEPALSNAVFALFLKTINASYFKEITIEYETTGRYNSSDTYFDLIVLRLKRSNLSICIPVPLLNERSLLALMKKQYKIVPRRTHNRRVNTGAELDVINELWIELSLMTGYSIEELMSIMTDYIKTS